MSTNYYNSITSLSIIVTDAVCYSIALITIENHFFEALKN